jgi:hypothetical protein
MPESIDPYREAVLSVLSGELKDELVKAEEQFRRDIAEALAAKGRAEEHIRSASLDRPFEVMEHELEVEYQRLVSYHAGKLARKIKWILEAWSDGEGV